MGGGAGRRLPGDRGGSTTRRSPSPTKVAALDAQQPHQDVRRSRRRVDLVRVVGPAWPPPPAASDAYLRRPGRPRPRRRAGLLARGPRRSAVGRLGLRPAWPFGVPGRRAPRRRLPKAPRRFPPQRLRELRTVMTKDLCSPRPCARLGQHLQGTGRRGSAWSGRGRRGWRRNTVSIALASPSDLRIAAVGAAPSAPQHGRNCFSPSAVRNLGLLDALGGEGSWRGGFAARAAHLLPPIASCTGAPAGSTDLSSTRLTRIPPLAGLASSRTTRSCEFDVVSRDGQRVLQRQSDRRSRCAGVVTVSCSIACQAGLATSYVAALGVGDGESR